MRKRVVSVLAAGVMGTVALLGGCAPAETPDVEAPAFSDAAATLSLSGEIDKTSEANRISADLFGLFLEDINFASFALDDNLLINSSFANLQSALSGGKLHGWSAAGMTVSAVTTDGVLSGEDAFRNADGTYLDEDHLCAQITAPGATLSNEGHPRVPIAVQEGTEYVFSAFIKGYTGKIALSVTDGTNVYAEGEIDVSGSKWVKYRTTLTATGTAAEDLRFVMTFSDTGTVYLDNVTLETRDANAATGIKSYLYDAIADLSPKFFRFPGGCVIEGDGTDEGYYDWKNSIGAVAAADGDAVPAFTYTLNEDGRTGEVTTYGEQATRTYNTDRWHLSDPSLYYQMEYGLGFYEYFMLCEELGAKAIPILNCGYSCQVLGARSLNGRHGNGIDDFIQDAFDLVAFAKGDPASDDPEEAYWAQVRADMGHPEPFEMDYLGIGNEQWGEYYTQYYEKFVVAFAEKAQENALYGSVRLIVGNCTLFTHCEDPDLGRIGAAQAAADNFVNYKNGNQNNTVDMYRIADYGVVDQHYYVNYTDLFLNHDLYDSYIRPADDVYSYYDVFVGEYAANSNYVRSPGGDGVVIDRTQFTGSEESNWRNALAEAAMMTGFERNGDIVKLAAYAPMFGNLNGGRQWLVDMMYYTNTDLVRTPSYYVQQLFMRNGGDYKVASSLTFASGSMPTVTFSSTGSVTRTVNQLYYVTSADEETGDILIKIVNAGETAVRFNVDLGDLDVRLSGIAQVQEVTGLGMTDTNALGAENVSARKAYTIGAFSRGSTFGYEVKPLSVTAIRVRTR